MNKAFLTFMPSYNTRLLLFSTSNALILKFYYITSFSTPQLSLQLYISSDDIQYNNEVYSNFHNNHFFFQHIK